jgi:hypothetical protein
MKAGIVSLHLLSFISLGNTWHIVAAQNLFVEE